MTKYFCPKCDKQSTKPEVEKILCLNCGKLTHIDTQSIKYAKPENSKKRKQKYILMSIIAAGSIIAVAIGLYDYSASSQFYEYSMECKKSTDNGTASSFDANLTLTQSEIEGSATQDCITYENNNYCYQVGMNEAPKPTDSNWSCDVLSVTQVSNYTSGVIVPTVPP